MLKQLSYYINYAWRLIGTRLCFLVFGIGSILMGYIIIPIVRLCTSDQKQKNYRAQHIISIAFRIFVFSMRHLRLVNFEFINFEELQSDQGCLIISNHPTLLDYVIIMSKLNHCNTIVKEQLWRNIFLKKIIQVAGYIPNTQSEQTFELIKKTLRHNNILIFPEGTRTIPGQALRLKRGAAQIAIRTNTPIRPIKIECNPSMLTKQNKWYHIPKLKPHFKLEVYKLIDSNIFLQDTGAPSLAARHLTKHLSNILEQSTTNEAT